MITRHAGAARRARRATAPIIVCGMAAVLAACARARPAPDVATVAIAQPVATASAGPAPTPPAPPPTPDASLAEGRRLYKQLSCNTCHEPDGNGTSIGPRLRGLAGSTLQLADGRRVVVDRAFVRGALVDPRAYPVPGYEGGMPSYRAMLDGEQLDALVAYLLSR